MEVSVMKSMFCCGFKKKIKGGKYNKFILPTYTSIHQLLKSPTEKIHQHFDKLAHEISIILVLKGRMPWLFQ